MGYEAVTCVQHRHILAPQTFDRFCQSGNGAGRNFVLRLGHLTAILHVSQGKLCGSTPAPRKLSGR